MPTKAPFSHQVRCRAEGCHATSIYDYTSLKDYQNGHSKHENWRCSRHVHVEELINFGNQRITKTYTVKTLPGASGKLFWVKQGESSGVGFIYGPGFKAFAADFIEGTSLTIEVTLKTKK